MMPVPLINFGTDWDLNIITLPERKALVSLWFLSISTELEKWFHY